MDFTKLYYEEKDKNKQMNEDLQNQKQEHEKAEKTLMRRIDSKQEEANVLEGKLESEKNDNREKTKKINQLESDLRSSNEKCKKLELDLSEKEHRNVELSKKIQNLEDLIQKNNEKIDLLNRELMTGHQKLLENNELLAIRDRDLEVSKAQVNQLERNLEDTKKLLQSREESNQKEIRKAKEEIVNLHRKTFIDKSDLEKMRTKLLQTQNDLRNSMEESNRLKPMIANLNSNYEDAQRNLLMVHEELLEYSKMVKNYNIDQQVFISYLNNIVISYCNDHNLELEPSNSDNESRVIYQKLMSRLVSIKKIIMAIIKKEIIFQTF